MHRYLAPTRTNLPHTARSIRHGVAAYGTLAFERRRPPADWVALGRPRARPRAASLDHITVSNGIRPGERAPARTGQSVRERTGTESVHLARRIGDLRSASNTGGRHSLTLCDDSRPDLMSTGCRRLPHIPRDTIAEPVRASPGPTESLQALASAGLTTGSPQTKQDVACQQHGTTLRGFLPRARGLAVWRGPITVRLNWAVGAIHARSAASRATRRPSGVLWHNGTLR